MRFVTIATEAPATVARIPVTIVAHRRVLRIYRRKGAESHKSQKEGTLVQPPSFDVMRAIMQHDERQIIP